jgi:hypothetical protein
MVFFLFKLQNFVVKVYIIKFLKYKKVSQYVLKITYFIEVLTIFNILQKKIQFAPSKEGIQYKVLKDNNGRKYNDFRH